MRKDVREAADRLADIITAIKSGVQLDSFTEHKVTSGQYITLMVIYQAKRCTMSYLAQSLRVTLPTVTGFIDRLVELKMVERSMGKKDRRKVYVVLSKKGMSFIRESQDAVRKVWTELLGTLTPSEVRQFQRTFEKIGRYLKKKMEQQ